MPHYKVKTSHGTVEFDADRANLSRKEVEDVINQQGSNSEGSGPWQKVKDALGGMKWREPLEMGGMLAGGAIGGATGTAIEPLGGTGLGAAVGAGLGKAFVKQGENVFDAFRGKQKPLGRQFQDIAEAGLSGAGAEAGGQVGLNLVSRGMKAISPVLPSFLKGSANVPKRATDILLKEEGNLPKGTAGDIQERVSNVVNSLKSNNAEAQARLANAKMDAGVYKKFEERVGELPFKSKKVPIKVIQKQFQELVGDKAGQSAEEIISSYAKQGRLEEGIRLAKNAGSKSAKLAPVDRIRELIKLRQAIDGHVDFPVGEVNPIPSEAHGTLKEMRAAINGQLDQIKEALPIRKADAVFASARKLYDRLQPAMKTPGKAEEFLQGVFSGSSPTDKENLQTLMELEKQTGQPVVQDLFREFAGREFQKPLSTDKLRTTLAGLSLFALRAIGIPPTVSLPVALASQSPKIMGSIIKRALQPSASALAEPVAASAVSLLMKRRNRK